MPKSAAAVPTGAEIEALVSRFYAEARRDPALGPVFNAAIGDAPEAWAKHEAKIAGFWRNALGLDKRGYQGSPMMTHAANRDVAPAHFPVWIDLFARCAAEVMRPEAAETITRLAQRIGSGLAMGLSHARGRQGPPALR